MSIVTIYQNIDDYKDKKKVIYEILTARLSVETPEITNMRRNEIMISATSARSGESVGIVPKYASGVTLNINLNVKLANKEPASCAPIYNGTYPKHNTITFDIQI